MVKLPPKGAAVLWAERPDGLIDVFDIVELHTEQPVHSIHEFPTDGYVKVFAFNTNAHPLMMWFQEGHEAIHHGGNPPYKRDCTIVYEQEDGHVLNWKVWDAFPLAYETNEFGYETNEFGMNADIRFDRIENIDPNSDVKVEDIVAKTLDRYGVVLT